MGIEKSKVEIILSKLKKEIMHVIDNKMLRPVRRFRLKKKCDSLIKLTSNYDLKSAEEQLRDYHACGEVAFSQDAILDAEFDLMIVIPVYNVEPFLEECIQSVINQQTSYSYVAYFVDDGSTDRSSEILERHFGDRHIRIIHQKNGGLSAARNRAIEHILGRYVLFLDSDDYLAPNAVDVMMRAADEFDADLVEGGHVMFEDNRQLASVKYGYQVKKSMLNEITVYPWGKLLKGTLLKHNCFPIGLWYEDTVIKTLICPECETIVTVPEVTYYYRQNPKGISKKHADKRCVDTYWITKLYLEEKFRRGHFLGKEEYTQFLKQLCTNQRRVKELPIEIQEGIFALSCALREKYFSDINLTDDFRLSMLSEAVRGKSFVAFLEIISEWNNL